jgi:hypothetical protein
MKLVSEIFHRNRLLATMGAFFLILAFVLAIYLPFNETRVLGINSMIKPIKFSLSIWIYAWSFAYLLFYVENQKKVRNFSILATIVMLFENGVIVVQAFRGKLSHFNQSEIVGGILYSLMGIMIVTVTIATLMISIRFIRQKTYSINESFALSIKIGLIFFVIFSFMGGYMSGINSHNVGGPIGESGLPILNWSTLFGDLRVAHFFGIHSLQIIPLFGYFISKNSTNYSLSSKYVWLFSIIYFAFVSFTLWQALMGMAFIKA